MDKIPQKVTKDPNRREAASEGEEKYRNRLNGSILNDERKGGEDTNNVSNDATNGTSRATTSATGAITRSSDTYISLA